MKADTTDQQVYNNIFRTLNEINKNGKIQEVDLTKTFEAVNILSYAFNIADGPDGNGQLTLDKFKNYINHPSVETHFFT